MTGHAPPGDAPPRGGIPWLAGIAFLAAALPLRYDGFGESDAARCANEAILWERTGEPPAHGYLARTSPAYLCALRGLLRAGVPAGRLDGAMNLSAPFAGGAVVVLAALLLRALLPSAAAGPATLLLAASPALVDGARYGMPTWPALALVLASLLCLLRATEARDARGAYGWIAASGGALLLALTFKADAALAAGAFPALLWLRGERRVQVWILAGSAAATAAVFAAALPPLAGFVETTPGAFAGRALSGTWRLRLTHLLQPHNRDIPLGYGLATSAAAAAGVLFGFARPSTGEPSVRKIAAALLLWAVPPLAFWSLVLGNSPRHLFVSYVPIAAMAGLALGRLPSPRARWGAAAAIVLANGWLVPPEGTSTSPRGRFLAYGAHRQAGISAAHAAARAAAQEPAPRKTAAGSWSLPYLMFESLARGERISVEPVPDAPPLLEIRDAGRTQTWSFWYVRDADGAAEARDRGWAPPFDAPTFLCPEFPLPGATPLPPLHDAP